MMCLLSLGRNDLWRYMSAYAYPESCDGGLTLDISNRLLEDLLQSLGVLQLLVDLRNHGLGEFPLLALLDLPFIPNPRVQHSLSFGGESRLLFQLVRLSLKLRGFLHVRVSSSSVVSTSYEE